MTPQEAFNWCEQFTENLVKVDIDTKRRTLGLQAMQVCKSALEKQIPKKATEETINRGIDISGEYDIDFNLCCPICGGIIGTFEGEVDEYFVKYCPNCGQALDWSDTE